MGIPLYYKNIIKRNPETIYEAKNEKVNNLLFDLNCAIHPCCAGKTDEKEMFQAILEKIKECIKITGVTDIIYIAIDGPAPRMKMEQQRQRRLKSSKEKKIWDTNQITPGTPFMKRLNKFIEKEMKKFKILTVFSDSNEPGEGEHKIMDFLDTNVEKDSISVVYGLDADLIMLSMIRKHNILLLRERTEYNIEGMQCNYIYLDINTLKRSLIQDIKYIDPDTKFKIDDDKILTDYLFYCFLVGNDFITPSPCNIIRYGGEEILRLAYTNLQSEHFGLFYLIEDDYTINMDNFAKFIEKLSKMEKKQIDKTLQKRHNNEYRNRKKFSHFLEKVKALDDIKKYTEDDFNKCDLSQNYEQFTRFSPSIFRENEDVIFKNENYRNLYYSFNIYNTCNVDPTIKNILEKDIFKMCEDYMKSIQWTFQYYFKECPEWRWYYSHDFAPLMIDMSEYLKKKNIVSFKKDGPYSPQEQLKIVLPHLEKNFMYPNDTPNYTFLKTYDWECHSILPHL
jgi:5'-3' exonuclease